MLAITSWEFYVFLFILCFIYFSVSEKYQYQALLCASVIFYWTYSQWLIVCILAVIVLTWMAGIVLDDKLGDRKHFAKYRKRLVAFYILICLGILAFFKFSYKFSAWKGKGFDFLESLVAPVGISFYTLQAIGYVMDVYRGNQKAERKLEKVALFLLYFPQILQGPINRYQQMSTELLKVHRLTYKNIVFGSQRILWGLFKKWVVADRAAILVNEVFRNYTQYGGVETALGAVLYTFQIYSDFSGGIDIMMGVSEILDIKMAENFNRPLFSKTVSEYWRRWHISLGAWFRDYLFYPIALSRISNRFGKVLSKKISRWAGKWIPSYIALMVLWTANGIWHGAGIQFVLYGFYYGVLMILSMVFEPTAVRLIDKLSIRTGCWSWKLWQVARTFFLTVFGRILYKSKSLAAFGVMVNKIFTEFDIQVLFEGRLFELGLDRKELAVLLTAIVILIAVELLQRSGSIRQKLAGQNLVFRWAVLYASIFGIMIFGWYGNGMSASDFIYYKY